MKCYECDEQLVHPLELIRGYCDECDKRKRTCTICGETVESTHVWVSAKDGKEVGRGHKECFESIVPTE